jgi:hypothetical protein
MLLREGPPSLPGVVLGVSVLALTAGVFALLAAVDGSWESWPPATCLSEPLGCFCERPRPSLVRQPSNTFSNLAFSLVGVVVLLECIEQQRWQQQQQHKQYGRYAATAEEQLGTAFACLYAVSQIVLGAGSAWYHASLTFQGQWIDNAAMYLTVSAPLLFVRASLRLRSESRKQRDRGGHVGGSTSTSASVSASSSTTTATDYAGRVGGSTRADALVHAASAPGAPTLSSAPAWRFIGEYVLMNTLLGVLCLVVPSSRRFIFAVLLMGLLGLEVLARRQGRLQRRRRRTPLLVAFFSFVVAFGVWTLDIRHILCDPGSMWQGHALWHVLNGVATFSLYLYYHPLAHRAVLPVRV